MNDASRSQPSGVGPADLTAGLDSKPSAADGERLSVTIGKLREAFRPLFDAQREEWEREGPAAMEALETTGATLDTIGGNCPVQAEGTVDGQRFYFRARGDSWQFHVAPTIERVFDEDAFYIERDYGDWPDAGWMPRHEAVGFIVQGISEYRKALSDGAGHCTASTPGASEASTGNAPDLLLPTPAQHHDGEGNR